MNIGECVEYLKLREKSVWVIREVKSPNGYFCGIDFGGNPIVSSAGPLAEQYERKMVGQGAMLSLDKSKFELVSVSNKELMIDKAVHAFGYIVALSSESSIKTDKRICYLSDIRIKDLDVVFWSNTYDRMGAYVFRTFDLAKNVVDKLSARAGDGWLDRNLKSLNLTPVSIEQIYFSNPATSAASWNIVEGLLYEKVEK